MEQAPTMELDTKTSDRFRSGHIPGEAGIWVFIAGDMLVFSLFFITFMVYRMQEPAVFHASQPHMYQGLGVLNTVLLLTSSWFVALAVQAVERGRRPAAVAGLALALCCGAGFVVVKFFEYGGHITEGITLNTNDFYMFYYMFTGIHLVHVLIGMGVLTYLLVHVRGAPADVSVLSTVESGASFWHLIDLLWIVLFGLFYLLR